MTDRSVTLTRRIAAAPARVWAAWTTADGLRSWYAPVEGWIVGNAEVDPCVGGGYRVTFGPEPDGDAYVEEGTYTIVDPITRLGWDGRVSGEGMDDSSRIDITLTPDGDGTVVDVVESGLSEESAADHEEGWTWALERLEGALAG